MLLTRQKNTREQNLKLSTTDGEYSGIVLFINNIPLETAA